uniref:Glutathione S-transferase theta 1a n=1 Tax=Pundamilia nyererei TaxID=303518 RepID=A0A3B4FIQ7_9CICH
MIELYLDLISPPCRAVFLFAKALGIPFEFKYVDLIAGQQYSSEFGKLNIVAKIPVMKDGGFTLSERYSRASSFRLAFSRSTCWRRNSSRTNSSSSGTKSLWQMWWL